METCETPEHDFEQIDYDMVDTKYKKASQFINTYYYFGSDFMCNCFFI